MTTPPPTMTGRPRSRGSSRCSTDAKKASRSACRIVASSSDTNTCSHGAPHPDQGRFGSAGRRRVEVRTREERSMDWTVVAIPGYFGSMGAEYLWLKRRAEREGPSPVDYERHDTVTSLTAGVA